MRSHTRRSRKASGSDATKPLGGPGATHNRAVTVRGAAATALAERKRALIAREASVRRREDELAVQEAERRARETSAQTGTEIEQLMGQMREAERLIIAAVHAQDLSDEAHEEAARARTELDDLMSQLRDANQRLAAAVAQARMMAMEAEERQEEYRQLSNRLLTLQDNERRRLADDLHDSTGQQLVALTMSLEMVARSRKALDPRSRRALAESLALARQCSRDVRTLAYRLHPPLLDLAGLLSAVRWYAKGFAKRSGIRVVMDLEEIGRLPGPIETALFRVVEEALTNVHRHASSATATIRVTATATAVALEVQDQGRGRSDRAAHENGAPERATMGVGIRGMRERIRQLGGILDVEFTDEGTTVRVCVPLRRDIP